MSYTVGKLLNPAFQWSVPGFYSRWKCSNGEKCISKTNICDGNTDCHDVSDEKLEMCEKWNCLSGMRKCSDGVTCIRDSQICDGISGHCPGGTDEVNCAEWSCISGYTKCSDGLQCIAGNFCKLKYTISMMRKGK